MIAFLNIVCVVATSRACVSSFMICLIFFSFFCLSFLLFPCLTLSTTRRRSTAVIVVVVVVGGGGGDGGGYVCLSVCPSVSFFVSFSLHLSISLAFLCLGHAPNNTHLTTIELLYRFMIKYHFFPLAYFDWLYFIFFCPHPLWSYFALQLSYDVFYARFIHTNWRK